eukprot:gene46103-62451_t
MMASTASAQSSSDMTRNFGAKDLFGLQAASNPQVRPDGRAVVYVRISNDIMTDAARSSIWLADLATGSQTPVEAGDANVTSPRWSPDGSRLARDYLAEKVDTTWH